MQQIKKDCLRPRSNKDKLEGETSIGLDQCYSEDQTIVQNGLAFFNKQLGVSMHVNGVDVADEDLFLWGVIRANPLSLSEVMSGSYPNIESWYKEFMEKLPRVREVEAFLKESPTVCCLYGLI